MARLLTVIGCLARSPSSDTNQSFTTHDIPAYIQLVSQVRKKVYYMKLLFGINHCFVVSCVVTLFCRYQVEMGVGDFLGSLWVTERFKTCKLWGFVRQLNHPFYRCNSHWYPYFKYMQILQIHSVGKTFVDAFILNHDHTLSCFSDDSSNVKLKIF